MKKGLFILSILALISCQKEQCKQCTSVVIVNGKTEIYQTQQCGEHLEKQNGQLIIVTNSTGEITYFIMTTCK